MIKLSRAADAKFFYVSALILIPCVFLCVARYESGSSLALEFLAVLVVMLLGSFVEIPVYTLPTARPKYTERELALIKKMFGVVVEGGMKGKNSVVTLNIGGFVLPVAFSAYLLRKCPPLEVATLTLLIIILTYFISEMTGGVGVTVPSYVGIFAIPLGFLLCQENAAPLIFTSAILGILVGVVFRILALEEEDEGSAFLSVGGAGNFPAIFIIGLLSLLISCF
ncbi:DUF1614 domain-containing protein [Candidatus Alkanophaga liquidiphilum]